MQFMKTLIIVEAKQNHNSKLKVNTVNLKMMNMELFKTLNKG